MKIRTEGETLLYSKYILFFYLFSLLIGGRVKVIDQNQGKLKMSDIIWKNSIKYADNH